MVLCFMMSSTAFSQPFNCNEYGAWIDINTGALHVEWKDWDRTGSCHESVHDEYLAAYVDGRGIIQSNNIFYNNLNSSQTTDFVHLYNSEYPSNNAAGNRYDEFVFGTDNSIRDINAKIAPVGGQMYTSDFNVQLRLRNNDRGGSNCSSNYSTQHCYTQVDALPSIPAPTNLTASIDTECDYVQLNWDVPTIVRWASSSVRRAVIYRNGVSIDTTQSRDSYRDYSAVPGQTYSYQVKVVMFYPNNVKYPGNRTSSVSGKRYGPPSNPIGFYLERPNCLGHLQLNWGWGSSTNPDNFLVERTKTGDFNNLDTVYTLSGVERQMRDVNTQIGERYTYRLRARDLCPANLSQFLFSAYSDSVGLLSVGVPAAPTLDTIMIDTTAATIRLEWEDNSNVEEGYQIIRQSPNNQVQFDIPENSTYYIDNSANNCETYTFTLKLFNSCAPQGVNSTNQKSAFIPVDVQATFGGNNKLSVSDGDFGDRIELRWNTPNGQNESWNISRVDIATDDTTLIANIDGKLRVYSDFSAASNTLYNYFIQGVSQCGTQTILSNVSADNGFRLAFGTANGQVTYRGGTAVRNVKIVAETASGLSGNSADFSALQAFADAGNPQDFQSPEFSFLTHLKPNVVSGKQIIAQKGGSSGWSFALNNQALELKIKNQTFTQADTTIQVGNWLALGATVSADSVRLYLNGSVIFEQAYSGVTALDSIHHLLIGSDTINHHLDGNLDDVRFYNKALSPQEVRTSFDVYLNPSTAGLVGYWRFDEAFGNIGYDYSKTLQNSNKNHLSLRQVSFSNDKPTAALLTAGAYTDSLGSYFIPFIPFSGAGGNFTITPSFGIHTFTPTNRSVFISPNNANFSGLDFEDNSSFRFKAAVKYENTSCFEKDVIIKIDGKAVVKNGQLALSDNNGEFEIQVPIGPHVISVEKSGHTFSRGRFPATGTFDFQDSLNLDSAFLDETLMRVLGRVAGGGLQEALPPGMQRGKNNIGVATIPFASTNGCLTKNVTTNAVTGEFEADLPPLLYTINKFSPTNNPLIEFQAQNFDLSNAPPEQTLVDTLSVDSFGTATVDSVKFNAQRDFIYYAVPNINVLDSNNLTVYGEDSLLYTSGNTQETIPTNSLGLTYPVFLESELYKFNVSAFELYENFDAAQSVVDSVPLTDALIRINNDLAVEPLYEKQINPLDSFSGYFQYAFRAGQASTAVDTSQSAYSFTKTFNASVITQASTVNWEFNSANPSLDNTFRGVIFGGRSAGGQNFISSGPSIVTMILRDPPGSQSYASWEQGSTITTKTKTTSQKGLANDLNLKLLLGTAFKVGIGYKTETEVVADVGRNFQFETSQLSENEQITETTVTSTLSTRSDIEFVGAHADIFMGRAFNVRFGLASEVKLLDSAQCATGATDCYGDTLRFNGKAYQIGRKTAMFAVPEGDSTDFFYTASNIEGNIIPDLKKLRNQLLNDPIRYTKVISDETDSRFGLSNDNPVFIPNTGNPLTNELVDSAGQSYQFHGYTFIDTIIGGNQMSIPQGTDSVWVLNQQIRIWEDALARNEKEKVQANSTTFQNNLSFGGGTAYSRSISTTKSETNSETVSYNIDTDLLLKLGTEVGGIGFQLENTLSLNYETTDASETTNATSSTFSYHLSEINDDDRLSVDIHDSKEGFGPIFKTVAGNTSCPHEPEVKTKYFQKGTVINVGTVQQEIPQISANPVSLFNVPAKGVGNINLSLTNAGPVDKVYDLKILQGTNPNGAILKIDGTNPNRSFAIPAGTSVNKVLTIEKGPTEIRYPNIGIVLHSQCQYASATANYVDIADTVYVSVNFLPSCTKPKLISPLDQFVLNQSLNDTLPVIISDYDINQEGLKKISLQYKAASVASWTPISTEWFVDTSGFGSMSPKHPSPKLIPNPQPFILHQLDMRGLTDQDYQIRAAATCEIPNASDKVEYSAILTGTADRKNPRVFGTPSPADGVLDPNDDIKIKFNERVKIGALTKDNFQLRGVLNNTSVSPNVAIAFDGSNSYLELDNGFDFANRDFTLDFWVKRKQLGSQQTIISQGNSASNLFQLSFRADNKIELKSGDQSIATNYAVTNDSTWIHLSVAVDKTNHQVEIIERDASGSKVFTNTNFFGNFQSGGKTIIGKSSLNNAEHLNASLYEFRIWNQALTNSSIQQYLGKKLSGREAGLILYYRMNKGEGDLVADLARFRNAEMNASWEFNPSGYSAKFSGNTGAYYLDSIQEAVISEQMDMTIEFWFKTAGGRLQSMLSNGTGRMTTTDNNPNSWDIQMDASNRIHVFHDSIDFVAVSNDFADGQWHHFALVMNRSSSITAFIDGNQQNSMSAQNFNGFESDHLGIGARYFQQSPAFAYDLHFMGNIDELRIWNAAQNQRVINELRGQRLKGDEFGLQYYFPFDELINTSGQQSFNPTLFDGIDKNHLLEQQGILSSLEKSSPPITISGAESGLSFDFVVNNDEIIISPNEGSAKIENVTLKVSAKNVEDEYGNVMQSPKSWIAFVNKNQVRWQDVEKNIEKDFNQSLSFTAIIANSGGATKNFTISNLPAWLTASPNTGTLAPLSTQTISFTVNSGINIGDYSEDVLLTTDFGFDEKLLINLKVRKTAPDFSFNAATYQQSMSIIGQIRINGRISTNEEDWLVAFSGNEIRGAAQLRYIPSLDKFIAFLDVYSNQQDSLSFKVWNALEGELHEEVTPRIKFVDNSLRGSLTNPQYFDALNLLSKPIPLNAGWNWVSFPLNDEKLSSISNFASDLNFRDGDLIKTRGHNANANYGGPGFGWTGDLTSQGLGNQKSYLIHISESDTIQHRGLALDPDTVTISVVKGWNRIGFVATKNLAINTALANYNATDGDLIKSQQAFSVYSNTLGWVGSLTTLEPTEGYLLKSADSATFTYPRRGLFRMKSIPAQVKLADQLVATNFELNPYEFEASTNAIIKVNTCREILEDSAWVLTAFKDDELRGFSAKSLTLKTEQDPLHFITIFGEANEKYELLLFNKKSKQKLLLEGEIRFQKNTVQGRPTQPLLFDVEIKQDCDQFKTENAALADFDGFSYPNPFTDYLTILVPKEISANGSVEIVDQNGRVLFETTVGNRERIFLNGAELHAFSNGVYQLKFVDEENVVSEKLIRVK